MQELRYNVLESIKRNLLPWISVRTSVSDMKYMITVCFYRMITVKSRRHGESYSLLGRHLWPIADIWLRRVVNVSQTLATRPVSH